MNIVTLLIIYIVVVFILPRFFIPYLGFRKSKVPSRIPKEMQKTISKLKKQSKNKEDFLLNINTFSKEVKIWREISDKFEDILAKHKIKKIIV